MVLCTDLIIPDFSVKKLHRIYEFPNTCVNCHPGKRLAHFDMPFLDSYKSFNKYFLLSKEDKAWGIHILDYGSSIIPEGAVFPQHSHPDKYYFSWHRGRILQEFQIIYLYKGQGVFESHKTGRITLKEGSVILIFPGVWHRYKPQTGCEWRTFWVGFNGSFANKMMEDLQFNPDYPVIKIGYQKKIIQIFRELFGTGEAEFSGYQQVLSGEIIKLTGWINALKRKADFPDTNVDDIIRRARIIIINGPDDLPIKNVAEELNMGYSKFRKLFKKYTGMAPGQYQLQLKLRRSIDLLYDLNKPIKEIAIESGFQSAYYFSRFFKRKMGCSPVSYRKKIIHS